MKESLSKDGGERERVSFSPRRTKPSSLPLGDIVTVITLVRLGLEAVQQKAGTQSTLVNEFLRRVESAAASERISTDLSQVKPGSRFNWSIEVMYFRHVLSACHC